MFYKFNYVVGAFLSMVNSAADLLYLWYVFQIAHIQLVAGVDYIKFFFVYGLFEFNRSVLSASVMDNSYTVQESVYNGELDEFLLKPVSTQFYSSIKYFWPEQLMIAVISLIFLSVLMVINGFFGWGWVQFVYLVFIVISSLTISFLFIWSVSLMAFFWDRFNQIKSIFWVMSRASYYPRDIYPRVIQLTGLYLIPFFMIINPAFDLLAGRYGIMNVANTVLFIIVWLLIYQMLWKAGLRKYNSAN